jgi:hypothetical protein
MPVRAGLMDGSAGPWNSAIAATSSDETGATDMLGSSADFPSRILGSKDCKLRIDRSLIAGKPIFRTMPTAMHCPCDND